MAYAEHKQALQDLMVHGKKKAAKDTLKANGWGKHLSPIWELEWVRINFYKCFGICSLHLVLLGIGKVHLFYFALFALYSFLLVIIRCLLCLSHISVQTLML